MFARTNSGFDAFVGNPPFVGGKNISGTIGDGYLDWLKTTYVDSAAQTDLVAYFFQHAYLHLADTGCFGLISTNTIAQGDTRRTSLRFIRKHGGTIYSATRRLKWPGIAAVIVSVVHVTRQTIPPPYVLDGKNANSITAYLLDKGIDDDPKKLMANSNIAFTGGYPYGAGFTFDDNDSGATTLREMHSIIESNTEAKRFIRPYIGGAEILNDPNQQPSRFVIDFGEMDEEEAKNIAELYAILKHKVLPERLKLKDNTDGLRRKKYWWQWGRTTPSLDKARRSVPRVLTHPFTTNNLVFAFVESNVVVASPHPVFVLAENAAFGVLQSRVHETWVRLFASSFKDDLRYTASDCFDTFPFPVEYQTYFALSEAGERYYSFRSEFTAASECGLTKTYNRFNNVIDNSPDIVRLRQLHDDMDREVLKAYDWADLAKTASCEFLLDYDSDQDDADEILASRGRKPWRLRWPDEFRDEVLARLLELNESRAAEERRSGAAAEKKASKKSSSKKATKKKPVKPTPLLDQDGG